MVWEIFAEASAMSEVLSVENVTLRFGGLTAVSDFSLTLGRGELAGLIGPNGAGKTTVFNILSGVYKPQAGRVQALGRSLLGLKPHEIADIGLTRTFQNIRLFKSLSVLENILIAFHHEAPYGFLAALLVRKDFKAAEARFRERAARLLALLDLESRASDQAGSLPYGEQKKLEIARAVATGCRILLLDEPAAGMNPGESEWLMQSIKRLQKDFDLSLLLIEHDMKVVMGICDRIHVLDHGLKIAEGSPSAIQKDARVIEAYLGRSRKRS
jgi:branched-chain amino acid transport system ATP-binding protein